MAVTKIWAIKDSLFRVVDYAANPEKTVYSDLQKVIHYTKNENKTVIENEQICYVTGVNCNKETTFEELYYHINEIILKEGFVNLDFMGNLGHSIVKDKNERVYIEKGNTQKISDVEYFTFEPHISIPDSSYGYKKENIYYFQNGKLVEL